MVSNSTLLFNFTTIVVSSYEQVIDCEKEKAAENGVEKLVASKCSIGSDQEARVFCFDVCSENTEDQDNCKCGTMVYKHGREIHEEELYEYDDIFSHYDEYEYDSLGVPLTELTALVHTFVYISTNFFGTTVFLGWNRKLSFTVWTHDKRFIFLFPNTMQARVKSNCIDFKIKTILGEGTNAVKFCQEEDFLFVRPFVKLT